MSYALFYSKDTPDDYPQKTVILSDDPLFIALQNRDKSTFTQLVEAGADVNIYDERGVTPLHLAAYEGLLPQVRLLLRQGANPNARTSVRFFEDRSKRRAGETPIEWAVHRVNNRFIVDLLTDVTDDVGVRRARGLSRWEMAMMRGDEKKVIQELDKIRDVEELDPDYWGPMEKAARRGLLSVVQYLLDRGVSQFYEVDECGETRRQIPLNKAAEFGHYDVVKLLIEHGSPYDATNGELDSPPLYYSATKGYLKIAKLLLRYGADPEASNLGDTAFAIAAGNNDIRMVKLFLRYGADPNMIGINYETPIYDAARNGAIRTLKVLLEAGANVNWKNEREERPIFDAIYGGHAKAIEMLMEYGASLEKCNRRKSDPPLVRACYADNRESYHDNKWLDDWDAGERGGLQPPPPEYYEKREQERNNRKRGARFARTVQILLDHGFDPNVRDGDRNTPLHGAATTGDANIAKLLIKAGADLDAIGSAGKSPLALAKELRNEAVVKVLLSHGAKEIINKKHKRIETECAKPDDAIYTKDGYMDLNAMTLRDAENGDPFDMNMVAEECIENGKYSKALKWLHRAADEHNHAEAMVNIGFMHARGQGVKRDYQEAEKWFLKAANTGDNHALMELARAYLKGDGFPRDPQKAIYWCDQLGQRGGADGWQEIADMNYQGIGVAQDFSQALKWALKAAEAGNVNAMHNVGIIYNDGMGVPVDYNKARYWFEKAAKKGFAPAMNSLGTIYVYGLGTSVDYQKAMRWYQKGTDRRNATATLNLAIMYEKGEGVPVDYRKAFAYYKSAASRGEGDALLDVARLFYRGQGVPKCRAQSVRWNLMAARKDIKEAWFRLGMMYAEGIGVKQDYRQARYWLLKSARVKDSDATYNLAVLYEGGKGFPQDYSKALRWYQRAAKYGDKNAAAQIRKLQKEIAPH